MPTTEARQIALLEKQLENERKRRKKAEELLHTKTVDLFHANQYLATMTEKVQYAVWAEKESIWEYHLTEDAYYLYRDLKATSSTVQKYGTFNQFIDNVHKDDRLAFISAWQDHLNDSSNYIEIRFRRYSEVNKSYRWGYLRGRKTIDPESGKIQKVAGVFKDIHKSYLNELSYKTVANTFKKSKFPAFIIDHSTGHIVVSKSFCQLVGCKRSTVSQNQLQQILPIDAIIFHQKGDIRTFEEDLLRCDATTLKCDFSLPELLQTKDDGNYRFVVGFIKPK